MTTELRRSHAPVPGATVAVIPDNGDYLTDGTRLLMVFSVRERGLACEDAATEEGVLVLWPDYAEGRWSIVRRRRELA